MGGYLPSSEAELERVRPPTSRTGVFPVTALQGGEKVLYETRPKISTGRWVIIFVFGIFVLLFALVVATQPQDQGANLGAGIFALFLFALPIFIVLGLWSRVAYAMTDQRVLTRSGSDFQSVSYDQITSVSMTKKSATVVFHLAPPPAGSKTGLLGSSRAPTMVWSPVPGAPAVVSFAQSAVAYYRIRNRQRDLRQQVTVASLMDRIVCPYCGARIDIATLSPDNPKCPSCAAPVIVAPMGL
ncbi:MAG: hypothetical protein L3K15_01035 [Thermoplasmata archaeon]|nr:hypothetical protein [Thermoplasmata archaeon]